MTQTLKDAIVILALAGLIVAPMVTGILGHLS